MNPLLNLIWLLCGGIFTAIEYLISSLLMMITIIGIPFGFQTLKLAGLALWPFGKEVRSTPDSGGCLSIIMNIIWLFLVGIRTLPHQIKMRSGKRRDRKSVV